MGLWYSKKNHQKLRQSKFDTHPFIVKEYEGSIHTKDAITDVGIAKGDQVNGRQFYDKICQNNVSQILENQLKSEITNYRSVMISSSYRSIPTSRTKILKYKEMYRYCRSIMLHTYVFSSILKRDFIPS